MTTLEIILIGYLSLIQLMAIVIMFIIPERKHKTIVILTSIMLPIMAIILFIDIWLERRKEKKVNEVK